jgi:hypothetical protein
MSLHQLFQRGRIALPREPSQQFRIGRCRGSSGQGATVGYKSSQGGG